MGKNHFRNGTNYKLILKLKINKFFKIYKVTITLRYGSSSKTLKIGE